MSRLQETIDRSIAKHGFEIAPAHRALLEWYDSEWPDPRKAPEVLRVSPDLFNAVMTGLAPIYRFCDARILEAGVPTVRLRPFGNLTSLVRDPSASAPTPDTIDNVVALAANPAGPWGAPA